MKIYDVKDIASGLSYRFFRKGDKVFEAGENGEKYYIIIKGVATILVPFGLDKNEVISRWEKFRDTSLDQY